MLLIVIPVKTGIQYFQGLLDSRLRGNDSVGILFKGLFLGVLHFSELEFALCKFVNELSPFSGISVFVKTSA